ncbi:hydroxymethylbilane synthase [Sneathiella chungangensis]|uniref:Porphobilinogen deaminase n=1 Tax=Sneathiella chungangensis TaxID=1418234 RepID=A0A845MIS5_9PROT|nr:hydroxymethylbilane synthase [Sneathiella chungangensis]MZR23943.1 hydroxymethylbilane synthase [Sneathiella chungangensis]
MAFVKKYRIGTRGSPLALAQAEETRTRLLAAHETALTADQLEIVVIKTTGDQIQDRALSEAGGKGLFVKEIEEALLSGRIDFAVHSMKDMETTLPPGLIIDCILPREDARDAFISASGKGLADLPAGALVGTSSLRRQAQVLNRRPDLKVGIFRGSVETRLRKLAEGQADATLLALAGLKRLGNEAVITELLNVDDMLPAVAQGAIGIERRADDDDVAALLAPISDSVSLARISCERAMLAVLDGSCRTPIAGYAELVEGNILYFRASLLAEDGSVRLDASGRDDIENAVKLGERIGAELKTQARGAKLSFGL